MNKKIMRALASVGALAIAAIMPVAPAYATDGIDYDNGQGEIATDVHYYTYDGAAKKFVEATAQQAYKLTSATQNLGNQTVKWYVVPDTETVSMDRNLNIHGEVNIILGNKSTLTVKKGVHLNTPNKLNIYAKSTDPAEQGALIGNSSDPNGAGIGGNQGETMGTLTVYGGHITGNAAGIGEGNWAAGIGGGLKGNGGTLIVYGGSVVGNAPGRGAGIGAGAGNAGSGGQVLAGTGGTVKVVGGSVSGTSKWGAGIGGAYFGGGADVVVEGGRISGKSTDGGAGIGGGNYAGNRGQGRVESKGNAVICASSVGVSNLENSMKGILVKGTNNCDFIKDAGNGKFELVDNVPANVHVNVAGKDVSLIVPKGKKIQNSGQIKTAGQAKFVADPGAIEGTQPTGNVEYRSKPVNPQPVAPQHNPSQSGTSKPSSDSKTGKNVDHNSHKSHKGHKAKKHSSHLAKTGTTAGELAAVSALLIVVASGLLVARRAALKES